MELIKIRLDQLKDFINSETYLNFSTKPISPKRALSYINNPNSKSSDIVLYYISDNNKLIAFRTIWADIMNNGENSERFGWLSGNWVKEEHRGKGLAQISLKEAMKDWDNKLMVTNFSIYGMHSFKKSNYFKYFYHNKGLRAYFSFSIYSRFKDKKILLPFLLIADAGIYIVSRLLKLFYSNKISEKYRFEILNFPDNECLDVAEKKKNDLIFSRGKVELDWIFSFPWMTDNIEDNIPDYPFSSYSKEFYYKVIKVYTDNKFVGFFVISVRNGNLKTLCFYFSEIDYSIIFKWIKNYAIKNNLSMVTILNKELIQELKSSSFPFLLVRDFETDIYSTFDWIEINKFDIQDGDGDYIFT